MTSTQHPTRLRASDFGLRTSGRFRVPLAFSLIEILIVVALLSVIVLGLMAMFGQTQRAFRLGMAQTDVLEAGRAATDLVARELGQVRPSYQSGVTNFHAWIPPQTPLLQELPGMQAAPGNTGKRVNFLMDLFFLTAENQRWTATGYTVRDPDDVKVRPQSGVGTLYRYTVDNLLPAYLGPQAGFFLHSAQTNFSRIADGVVHFRVRAFDSSGLWITNELPNNFNFHKSDIRWSTVIPTEIGLTALKSNAVPGAVEIELGFVETRTLARADAMPDIASRNYLSNHAGQVHIFRHRISIPTADAQAYQ